MAQTNQIIVEPQVRSPTEAPKLHIRTEPYPWRVTPKYDSSTEDEKSQYHVSPAALKAKTTPHITEMAQPRYKREKYTPLPEESTVSPKALTAKLGPRTNDLSLPKETLVKANLEDLRNEALKKALKLYQKLIKHGLYSKLIHKCKILRDEENLKAQLREKDKNVSLRKRMKELQQWIELRSKAKEYNGNEKLLEMSLPRLHYTMNQIVRMLKLAEPLQRRITVKYIEREETREPTRTKPLASARVKQLALPKPYYDNNGRIWAVSESALRGRASSRIKNLSKPKVRESQTVREFPYEIPASALSATASSRTVKLAESKKRVDTTVRDYPYAISPLALEAKCSKKVKCLSQPKIRYDEAADCYEEQCRKNRYGRRKVCSDTVVDYGTDQKCFERKDKDDFVKPYLGYPVLERYDETQKKQREKERRMQRHREKRQRETREQEDAIRKEECEKMKKQQDINNLIRNNNYPKCYTKGEYEIEEGEIIDSDEDTNKTTSEKTYQRKLMTRSQPITTRPRPSSGQRLRTGSDHIVKERHNLSNSGKSKSDGHIRYHKFEMTKPRSGLETFVQKEYSHHRIQFSQYQPKKVYPGGKRKYNEAEAETEKERKRKQQRQINHQSKSAPHLNRNCGCQHRAFGYQNQQRWYNNNKQKQQRQHYRCQNQEHQWRSNNGVFVQPYPGQRAPKLPYTPYKVKDERRQGVKRHEEQTQNSPEVYICYKKNDLKNWNKT